MWFRVRDRCSCHPVCVRKHRINKFYQYANTQPDMRWIAIVSFFLAGFLAILMCLQWFANARILVIALGISSIVARPLLFVVDVDFEKESFVTA